MLRDGNGGAMSLTERDCLVAAQQYDPELMHHLSVPRKGYTNIDASALLRCHALRMIDVTGNKLTTLVGIECIAPQLTFLNAAENRLVDIAPLASCAALTQCMLEGNMLTSPAALQPLVALPCLSELVLQRQVSLSEEDAALATGQQSGGGVLLLDNPVCRDAAAYQAGFLAKVPHIRWVDGVSSYRRARLLEEEADATVDANSSAALIKRGVESLKAARAEMTAPVPEEATLRSLLNRATSRCTTTASPAATPSKAAQA